ncbi:GyrI-like domain-containing protein [Heyndrickxia vini]|uniref:GyrI-like domain-containing protein n=1 Tax=Heyndrickxia vini TaxID=1476025 RepID=UPI001FE61DC0|nr:GyrI-like domain-containing protein [Heyndrickxia vini]
MSYEIITLPAYRTVGLKWEGTFSEIVPNLKNVIQHVEDRADELENRVNPNVQLGLSYHVRVSKVESKTTKEREIR